MSGEQESPIRALVARTAAGLTHSNTLAVPTERRLVVVAQGKQFHNADLNDAMKIPDILQVGGLERMMRVDGVIAGARAKWEADPDPDKVSRRDFERDMAAFRRKFLPFARHEALDIKPNGAAGEFVYENAPQGVSFDLKFVTKKSEFVQYLTTPDAHVVYAGHARYGRGPCFGDTAAPGEEWEEGTGTHPNDTGIFRLGFPFLAVPISEIYEHRYTANLVSSSVKLKPKDCTHELRAYLPGVRAATLDKIDRLTARKAIRQNHMPCDKCSGPEHSLASHALAASPDDKFWYYVESDEGLAQPHIVLHAGWQNTTSAPDDLDAQLPECRVFCHFGCSTGPLNQPVLRRLANWTREGDNHYAYFTTRIATNITVVFWLQHLLSYGKFNAFMPWKPSIDYAFVHTNKDLAAGHWGFQIW